MLKVYTKNNCQACDSAKKLLQLHGFDFQSINVDEDFDAYDFIVSEGHRSFPQIYSEDGTLFVEGGFKGLQDMFSR